MNTLRHFVLWLDVPIEEITHKKLLSFIDHLLDKRLKPKTINCYLYSIRGFYEYLINEEQIVAASAALSSRRTNYKTL
jgi:site-specific recombinase XerD